MDNVTDIDSIPDIDTVQLKLYVPLANTEVDFTKYTNLLFVDHGAADTDMQLHCNSNTYAILYDFCHDSDSIMDYVKQFSNVKRISFAFHGQPTGTDQYIPHLFMNEGPLFDIDDVSNNNSDLSKNMSFVIGLIQHFTLDNLDFLGCNLLKNTVWTQYLDVLQKKTNTIIGASDDNTGNINYGGDWVLENTMENVKNIYFDESINNYANLLATITVDDITYITNEVDNTAKITFSEKPGSVVIPSSITNNGTVYNVNSIGDKAFYYKKTMTSFFIPKGVTSIGEKAFMGNAMNLVTFEAGSELTSIGISAFAKCTYLTTMTIPNKVRTIGEQAFSWNSAMNPITFEAGSELTSISDYTFTRCTSLTSMTLPNKVRTIGVGVFQFNKKMKSVTLPEGLISIGSTAFAGSGIYDITFPRSVTTLGIQLFTVYNRVVNVTLTVELQAIYGNIDSAVFMYFIYITFINHPILPPPDPDTSIVLDDAVKEAVKSAVPTVTDNGSGIITIPTLSDPTIFSSGSTSEKRSKRKVFFKDFFTKNSAVVTGKTIKMNKETLLGETSIISKPNMQVMKAENTETPVDTSSLASDEGIYAFIANIDDFIVLQMGTDKKLKVEKLNDLEYNIYEDYVGVNSQVTSVMSEGQNGNYNDFGYQIGSFSGPTDPSLIPVPICFPAGTPVMTDQGNIHIDKIKPNINTINGKCIIDITVTIPNFENMVCIEEGALGMNSPSLRTEISPDHCVLYNGEMRKAIELTEVCDKVNKIPHNNEKLYNVLMEKHDRMCINNMICETLHPDNILVEVIRDSELSNKDKTYLFKKYEQLKLCK